MTPAMARELFVYWKLDASRAEGAAVAAARMQTELLQAHPALEARFYRRSDIFSNTLSNIRNDMATLMETYASSEPGGVGSLLQAAIEAAAARHLASWCSGPRHVETFDRLSA